MTDVNGYCHTWKGRYGFLSREDGESDVFVHANELPNGVDYLREGQGVTFNIGEGRDGKTCATNVRLLP